MKPARRLCRRPPTRPAAASPQCKASNKPFRSPRAEMRKRRRCSLLGVEWTNDPPAAAFFLKHGTRDVVIIIARIHDPSADEKRFRSTSPRGDDKDAFSSFSSQSFATVHFDVGMQRASPRGGLGRRRSLACQRRATKAESGCATATRRVSLKPSNLFES